MTLDALGPLHLAALLGSGLLAGFLNTVAGGGSLLTLPALLLVGLPPAEANASNRVSILLQSLAAAHGFGQSGALPGRLALRLVAPTLLGALLGAAAAARLPPEVLEPVLLGTLVAMALWFTLRPHVLARPLEPGRLPAVGPKAMAILVAAGFYGGFLQAGVGFLVLGTLAGVVGLDLVRANAVKVLLVLALTLVALVVFVPAGLVRWTPGLVVAAGSVVGARLGVRVAVRHTAWLRWLVLAAVVGSAVAVAVR